MFYIILFSGLAVLLIVAAGTVMARNRAQLREEAEHVHGHPNDAQRRQRKAKRQQSRGNRRKRH